jgi:hypothetical protein
LTLEGDEPIPLEDRAQGDRSQMLPYTMRQREQRERALDRRTKHLQQWQLLVATILVLAQSDTDCFGFSNWLSATPGTCAQP